jgi:hypothetical protein
LPLRPRFGATLAAFYKQNTAAKKEIAVVTVNDTNRL